MTLQEVLNRDEQFRYMLLGRLEEDCKFYLGYGARNPKKLWALEEKEHIQYMKALHNSFEEKPEWLSYNQIEKYEKEMR